MRFGLKRDDRTHLPDGHAPVWLDSAPDRAERARARWVMALQKPLPAIRSSRRSRHRARRMDGSRAPLAEGSQPASSAVGFWVSSPATYRTNGIIDSIQLS